MLVFARASQAAALAVAVSLLAGSALAQDQGRPNFLDNLFGGNNAPAPTARGGADEADLTVQINQLQERVRQLTGTIEQLQYRNQQLEQQVRALGGGNPAAGPAPGPNAGMGAPAGGYSNYPATANQQPPRGGMQRPESAQQDYPPPVIAAAPPSRYPESSGNYPEAAPHRYPESSPGRSSDVFDPAQNPNAPGAPRPLGSRDSASQPPIGAPYGRPAGAPLDLSTPGSERPQTDDQGMLPAPPPRNPNATGGAQMANVAPQAATPRDAFDLAYGYVQRKDYALAEDSLRAFLKKYPSDARVPDAQYWLGESLYQRQRYRDAAESFLAVSTKYDKNPKAPEALFRLGQSLAALGEKETACAAWGEIGRKYVNAPANVKKNVAAEQKRVRC